MNYNRVAILCGVIAFVCWLGGEIQGGCMFGERRAYRALRDSLATAQHSAYSQGAIDMLEGRFTMSDQVLREAALARRDTIRLLYRESDSTLRVARLRAEGR